MSTENNDTFIEAEVINRAKTIAHVRTDKDFADIIGVSGADFGQRKKRGTLLPLITRWAIKQNVDLNHLLKGDSITTEGVLDPDPEIAELMEGARRVLTSGNQDGIKTLEQCIDHLERTIKKEKRQQDDMEAIKRELDKLRKEKYKDGKCCQGEQLPDERAA